MKLHIVMHESFESPAAIEVWAIRKDFEISFTRLYEGDTIPECCEFDFLLVMGGPQSPITTREECVHFDSEREITLIQRAIAEKKIVLGVCLGAQFISQALGAGFERSPHREIGVFPVALTDEGKRDPLLHDFPDIFDVAHWHGDMPGLTPESKVLAASQGCPRQIVRYAPTVYGFQCHFEFTAEAVDDMIANSRRELEQFKGQRFVESPAELRAHEYGPMNELLFCFLDRLTARAL